MNKPVVSQEQIDSYSREGVVFIPGLLRDWVDTIRQGIDINMHKPGPHAAENLLSTEQGRFFDDYCNWSRIEEFERCIKESCIARAAAELMQSHFIFAPCTEPAAMIVSSAEELFQSALSAMMHDMLNAQDLHHRHLQATA